MATTGGIPHDSINDCNSIVEPKSWGDSGLEEIVLAIDKWSIEL